MGLFSSSNTRQKGDTFSTPSLIGTFVVVAQLAAAGDLFFNRGGIGHAGLTQAGYDHAAGIYGRAGEILTNGKNQFFNYAGRQISAGWSDTQSQIRQAARQLGL